jgi:hypothetical protein
MEYATPVVYGLHLRLPSIHLLRQQRHHTMADQECSDSTLRVVKTSPQAEDNQNSTPLPNLRKLSEGEAAEERELR